MHSESPKFPVTVTPPTTVGEVVAALKKLPQDAPIAVLHGNFVLVEVSVPTSPPQVAWVSADTVFIRASERREH